MNIELLRIILMFMIVTLHYLGHGGMLNAAHEGSKRYFLIWTLETFSYLGVNGFVLISGYYLVNSTFKVKKLLTLILQIVFTSAVIYFIFAWLGLAPVSKGNLFGAFFPIITGKYWFATSYICLYCLFPYLNRIVKSVSKRQFQFFVLLLCAMFCSWNAFLPVLTTMNTDGGYNVVWLICLYFFGAYLRLYWNYHVNKYLYLAGFILCCAFVVWKKMNGSDAFLSYVSVPITAASVLLFLFFRDVRIQNHLLCGVIGFVSSLTFGVYLISDNIWVRAVLYTRILHTSGYFASPNIAFIIPASILAIFVGSMLLDLVRKLLFQPVIRSAGFQNLCDKISTCAFLQSETTDSGHRAA